MENINPAEISAYVPSFNNEGTVEASVRSLLGNKLYRQKRFT